MLETVIKYGIIFYAMGVAMAIGVLAKVISHITARKMVKAASEIQRSNHRLMRLVKAKFEHASMVSDKVQNVEAFVKKYLYEYKVLGVRLDGWRSLPKKMIWLIVVFGAFGVLGSYQIYGMKEQTFQYGAFTGICAVLVFSISILSDEKSKLEAAKNYMVDYLENVCIHRYEKANQGEQILHTVEGAENETIGNELTGNQTTGSSLAGAQTIGNERAGAQTMENATSGSPLPNNASAGTPFSETPQPELSKEREEQEMRIRAILEEFLA
ncbi:MAG: hypothetical protein IJ439_07510 [Tyzzerella sp.]|nr:hypothetical protein [Tyzzerella sp.]